MSYEQDRFKKENFVQLLARPGTRLNLGDVGFIEEVDGEAKLVLAKDVVEALQKDVELQKLVPEGMPAIAVDENRVLTYLINADGCLDVKVENRLTDKVIVTINITDQLVKRVASELAKLKALQE